MYSKSRKQTVKKRFTKLLVSFKVFSHYNLTKYIFRFGWNFSERIVKLKKL